MPGRARPGISVHRSGCATQPQAHEAQLVGEDDSLGCGRGSRASREPPQRATSRSTARPRARLRSRRSKARARAGRGRHAPVRSALRGAGDVSCGGLVNCWIELSGAHRTSSASPHDPRRAPPRRAGQRGAVADPDAPARERLRLSVFVQIECRRHTTLLVDQSSVVTRQVASMPSRPACARPSAPRRDQLARPARPPPRRLPPHRPPRGRAPRSASAKPARTNAWSSAITIRALSDGHRRCRTRTPAVGGRRRPRRPPSNAARSRIPSVRGPAPALRSRPRCPRRSDGPAGTHSLAHRRSTALPRGAARWSAPPGRSGTGKIVPAPAGSGLRLRAARRPSALPRAPSRRGRPAARGPAAARGTPSPVSRRTPAAGHRPGGATCSLDRFQRSAHVRLRAFDHAPAALACTTIIDTLCAITSCNSRAIRPRSTATAASACRSRCRFELAIRLFECDRSDPATSG